MSSLQTNYSRFDNSVNASLSEHTSATCSAGVLSRTAHNLVCWQNFRSEKRSAAQNSLALALGQQSCFANNATSILTIAKEVSYYEVYSGQPVISKNYPYNHQSQTRAVICS